MTMHVSSLSSWLWRWLVRVLLLVVMTTHVCAPLSEWQLWLLCHNDVWDASVESDTDCGQACAVMFGIRCGWITNVTLAGVQSRTEAPSDPLFEYQNCTEDYDCEFNNTAVQLCSPSGRCESDRGGPCQVLEDCRPGFKCANLRQLNESWHTHSKCVHKYYCENITSELSCEKSECDYDTDDMLCLEASISVLEPKTCGVVYCVPGQKYTAGATAEDSNACVSCPPSFTSTSTDATSCYECSGVEITTQHKLNGGAGDFYQSQCQRCAPGYVRNASENACYDMCATLTSDAGPTCRGYFGGVDPMDNSSEGTLMVSGVCEWCDFRADYYASLPTPSPYPFTATCMAKVNAVEYAVGKCCAMINDALCNNISAALVVFSTYADGYMCLRNSVSGNCEAVPESSELQVMFNDTLCTVAIMNSGPPYPPGCHRCNNTRLIYAAHYFRDDDSWCGDLRYLPQLRFFPSSKMHSSSFTYVEHHSILVIYALDMLDSPAPFSVRVSRMLREFRNDEGPVTEYRLMAQDYDYGSNTVDGPLLVAGSGGSPCTNVRIFFSIIGWKTPSGDRIKTTSTAYTDALNAAASNTWAWLDDVHALYIQLQVANASVAEGSCTYLVTAQTAAQAGAATGDFFRDTFGNTYLPWSAQPSMLMSTFKEYGAMCASCTLPPRDDWEWDDRLSATSCASSGACCCSDFGDVPGMTGLAMFPTLSIGGCYYRWWTMECVASDFMVRPTESPTTPPTMSPTTSPTLAPTPLIDAANECTGTTATFCLPTDSACTTCLVKCGSTPPSYVNCADASAICANGTCHATLNDSRIVSLLWSGDSPFAMFIIKVATASGERLRITRLPEHGTLWKNSTCTACKRAADDKYEELTENHTLVALNATDLLALAVFYKPSPSSARATDDDSLFYRVALSNISEFGPEVRRAIVGRTDAPLGAYNDDYLFEEPVTDSGIGVGVAVGVGFCVLLIGGFVLVYYFRLRPRALAAGANPTSRSSARKKATPLRAFEISPPTPHEDYAVAPLRRTKSRGGGGALASTSGSVISHEPPQIPVGVAPIAAMRPRNAPFLIEPSQLDKGKRVGEGSFGFVYRGRWRDMEVAIKEVKLSDDEAVRQLMIEADGMQNLRPHANIVTLYGVCEAPFAIVTEFCERGSLDDLLYGSRPYPFADMHLENVVRGAARGVNHLHHESVIHRDLAARNVLVDAQLNAKIADFGMARHVTSDSGVQQTNTEVGPIKWMSPEQLNHQFYSRKSDVFSFGVVIYECMARQPPWAGIPNMRAAAAVLGGQHLPAPPRTPRRVSAIMGRCFKFKANERPAMKWVVKELNAVWDWTESAESSYAVPPKGGALAASSSALFMSTTGTGTATYDATETSLL